MHQPPFRFTAPQSEQFTYRVFHLDHRGAVCRAEIIDATSDVEACRIAASVKSPHGIALWERSRFLANYPGELPAADALATASVRG